MVTDLVPGLDLRPIASQAEKDMSALFLVPTREDCAPPQAGECRETLDRRSPPRDKGGILVHEGSHARGQGFIDAEWDDGRGIPEPHRPSARSSKRALRAAPRGSFGRGIAQKPIGSLPVPIRTSPALAS